MTDFMEIQTVGIRREGGENDPLACVVVSVQDVHGEWRDIGDELVSSNFSDIFSLPACWRQAAKLEVAS